MARARTTSGPLPLPGPATAEERAIAVRMRAGGADGSAARAELIVRNIGLAVGIARRAARRPGRPGRGPSLDDLASAARLGLVRAACRYDAGMRFPTYAGPRIWREIEDFLRHDRLVHVPDYAISCLRYERSAARRFRDRPGTSAATLEAARRSLGAGIEGDCDRLAGSDTEPWPDTSADPAEVAAESDEFRADRARLRRWLATLAALDPRLARVLVLRYGLDGGGERTQAEVAAELAGHWRTKARRLEREALERLREIAHAEADPFARGA